jgi:dTMP kinase
VTESTNQLPGTFVTFEGVDGSGKSTQTEALAGALTSRGYSVLTSREPGGTPVAERIRDILLDPGVKSMAWSTEVLLYLASRAEHVDSVLRPALERGEIVICDRFLDSTLAYQAFGRDGGNGDTASALRSIRKANELSTGGLGPELTFLLDLDPGEGLARSRDTGRVPDRLEGEGLAFLERVRAGFLQLAEEEPGRIVVVDGSRPPSDIAAEVLNLTLTHLRRK